MCNPLFFTSLWVFKSCLNLLSVCFHLFQFLGWFLFFVESFSLFLLALLLVAMNGPPGWGWGNLPTQSCLLCAIKCKYKDIIHFVFYSFITYFTYLLQFSFIVSSEFFLSCSHHLQSWNSPSLTIECVCISFAILLLTSFQIVPLFCHQENLLQILCGLIIFDFSHRTSDF